VATETKKKIDAKQFVRDVEAGMHATSLMAAYGLSPSELQKVFKKLEEKGMLKPSKPVDKTPAQAPRNQKTFACPSCGASHSEPFDECPNCGLVLSKIREPALDAGEYPLRDGREGVSSRGRPPVLTAKKTNVVKYVGIAAIILILVGAFMVHRWLKNAELRSLAGNVQAVLDASNAPNEPNYSRLGQIFGDATGAMAVVLESRRTPYSEKMHELYQKMVYLGELQTRMKWQGSGATKGTNALHRSIDAAGGNSRVVASELDTLTQGLSGGRRALADASAGPETDKEGPSASPGVIPRNPAAPAGGDRDDSTGAQFDKAQDELRSLCVQVLQILATR